MLRARACPRISKTKTRETSSKVSWGTSKLRTPSSCAARAALVYQPLRSQPRLFSQFSFNMDQREQRLQCALDSYNSHEFPSIRATARAHVVSESTLRLRINGITNRRAAHAYEQRLSIQQ
jgi:hypothetical protein